MAYTPSRQILIIAASILGSSVVMLGESVVTLALPSIARTLQVPFQSLQWAVDGYNLTLAALILFGGSLGDLFGLRRVYLWSATSFIILSIVCAFAWSRAVAHHLPRCLGDCRSGADPGEPCDPQC